MGLHTLYKDRDWHWFTSGASMQKVVSEAVAGGLLLPERRFDEPLYRSRVRRRYMDATVYILKNH